MSSEGDGIVGVEVNMNPFKALLAEYQSVLDNLGITTDQQDKLAGYLIDLWKKNQEMNLVSRKMSAKTLVTDHLLDCLIALPYIPKVSRIADLGSGGGFPAVPLAIVLPNTEVLLYEKSPLKCRFLKQQSVTIKNLKVMERLDANTMDSGVELVTARAFKPIAVIRNLTPDYFKRGGQYMLYKARAQKIEQELKDAGIISNQARIQKLNPIGDAEERHLVFLNAGT